MTSDNEDARKAITRAYANTWRRENLEAKRAYERAYYAKNAEKMREKQRANYASNPEFREANQARTEVWVRENRDARLEHQKRYREKNREKLREAGRQSIRDKNGNLTRAYTQRRERKLVQRAVDLEGMAGRRRPEVCEICGNPPDKGKALHFDHCHQRGHFRGWLCRGCNLTLGYTHEDIGRLRKLIAYLERDRNGAA